MNKATPLGGAEIVAMVFHHPHFHAYYQDHTAVFAMDTIEYLGGSLPKTQLRLVEAWAEIHRDGYAGADAADRRCPFTGAKRIVRLLARLTPEVATSARSQFEI